MMTVPAWSQSTEESSRSGWATYIFVSSSMPRTSLVQLGHDAMVSGATLVLAGFTGTAGDIQAVQRFVADIDKACCGERRVNWIIDPKLFDRYKVHAVPAFVAGHGTGADTGDFSMVYGDMTLGNALKFFTQESHLEGVRQYAAELYKRSFSSP